MESFSVPRFELRRPLRAEYSRGFSLLYVLWGLILIAAMIGVASLQLQRSADLAKTLRERRLLETAAESGTVAATKALLESPARYSLSFELDGIRISTSVRPESARIDLNKADPELLSGFIRNALPARGQTIARDVLEKRDEAALRTPSDLLAAGIVDAAEFAELEPHLTILTGQRGLHLDSAPEAILRHVPGVSTSALAAYIGWRAEPNGRLPDIHALFKHSQSLVPLYRVLSVAERDGHRSAIEVVLRFDRSARASTIWRGAPVHSSQNK